jgi:hypothetical protein
MYSMKEEIFEAVLNEILEEMRQVKRVVKEQNSTIIGLRERVEEFEHKLRDQQVIVQPPDFTSVERQIAEGLVQVAEAVEKQPKPVRRHVRISIFPESDREGSYKFFIRWLFGGTILALLVAALFFLGRQFLDNWHPAVPQPMLVPRTDTVDHRREHRRVEANGNLIHGLTSRDARKIVDSMVKAEKVKKIKDGLNYILMRDSLDSLRGNGVNQPQK